jgi:hypothetical protein
MASILAFAYSAVADKLGFDPKNEASSIAKYLEPNSSFRAEVEGWIDDVYRTVAEEFDQTNCDVIENGGYVNAHELKKYIHKQKQLLLQQVQERFDREFKPNWVVTVEYCVVGTNDMDGPVPSEIKLVRADTSDEAEEKATRACGLREHESGWWLACNPDSYQTTDPVTKTMPFDEWVRLNMVLA